MDITKMDVRELKALAYDVMSEISRNQNNLQVIQQEIFKRQKQEEKPNASNDGK